jgi:hypothetical protein
MGRTRRRILAIGCFGAAMVASTAPSWAAVTVGQTGGSDVGCIMNDDFAQVTVSTGNSYRVPQIPPATALSITAWSTLARSGPGQRLKLKVYRQVSGLTYTVVGQDLQSLMGGTLNTFPTNISVLPGDVLGLTNAGNADVGCGFGPYPETNYVSPGTDAPIGGAVTFITGPGLRLNISALVEPTNSFIFGKTKRNEKSGTATLTLKLPNPGKVTISGKGANGSSAAVTGRSKSVPAAGSVKLKIKAKGKKLAKLNRTGKVKLSLKITYTPTNGSPRSQSTKVKLKKG